MRTIIASLLLLFLSSAGSIAQSTFTVNGKVTDTENVPLPFVWVRIEEMEISTQTNIRGEYAFTGIPAGKYHLTVTLIGYKSLIKIINTPPTGISYDIMLEKSLIETPAIDVTTSFAPSDTRTSTYAITSLEARTLSRHRSSNLAATLESIPGVNNFSTGSGIGKPVIRGFTSRSVLVVHEGIKHESQQWGDEHAPEVGVFDLERIEILRGPASLMYGADGIGGVINIISRPMQFSHGKNTVTYGTLDLNGFTVNKEGAANLMLGLGFKNFGIKGRGGYRKSDNINTPEGGLTVSTPEGPRTITGGELLNSGALEYEAGISIGTNRKFGSIHAGYELFNREIQIHEDPLEEPDATPNQKVNTSQFELTGDFNLSHRFELEPVLSYQMHIRKEFESEDDKILDNPVLHLDLKTFQGDIRLHNELSGNSNGTFGVSYIHHDNKTLAEEKLIPNFDASSFGIYALQKYTGRMFTLTGGLRFDTKQLNIKPTVFETDSAGNTTKEVQSRTLDFSSVTGSAGFVINPVSEIDIFGNIGRGWRAPSEFELYVDGVHEGTSRFERGILTVDPSAEPEPEESLNFDMGSRFRYRNLNADISLYYNTVNNFIYPYPTGETDPGSGLPVFNIRQDKAVFYGMEYSVQVQPLEWLLLSLNGDYVHSENDVTGTPLPLTPAAKNIVEARVQKQTLGSLSNAYLSLSAKIVSPQNRVDALEAPTEGYTLLNAGTGFDLILSNTIASVDLTITNLAGTKYVDHLSRYRYYAMNPGRSFNLKLTVPFRF
jgi:iron complex outermembrane receptor protein